MHVKLGDSELGAMVAAGTRLHSPLDDRIFTTTPAINATSAITTTTLQSIV